MSDLIPQLDLLPTGRRRGLCLVIAAPSGAGKTTITRRLLAQDPNLTLSISATTRPPRPAEQDGIHYFFRSQADFTAMIANNDLLEHATVFAHRYGTPKAPVEAALAAGQDIVFDIDWQGHRQLRAALPHDTVSIFILPPSLDALKSRLQSRGDPQPIIDQRMQAALSEISHWREFDHIVTNTILEDALVTTRAILEAHRTEVCRVMEGK